MVHCYPYYVREFECEIQRQVKLVYGLLHLNLDLLVCVPMVLSCLVKDLDNKGLIEDSDLNKRLQDIQFIGLKLCYVE